MSGRVEYHPIRSRISRACSLVSISCFFASLSNLVFWIIISSRVSLFVFSSHCIFCVSIFSVCYRRVPSCLCWLRVIFVSSLSFHIPSPSLNLFSSSRMFLGDHTFRVPSRLFVFVHFLLLNQVRRAVLFFILTLFCCHVYISPLLSSLTPINQKVPP